jgi:uncharacterized damage-inducible protein DinB
MTYYGGREMAASYRTVRRNTLQIAQEIPESQYGYRAAPDCRTVGQTLAHIAIGPWFQLHVHQNRIDDLAKVNFPALIQQYGAEEAKPRTKAEILAMLESEGERFASYVESLDEGFLAERVAMPQGATPATKSRLEMLLSPKEHEMHHRGQLMLVERMIGLVPHLTRQYQERMAQTQAAAARK